MSSDNLNGDEPTEGENQGQRSDLWKALWRTPIGGRYQLRRIIGKGHYGCVFVAYDMHFEIEVALKILIQESSPGIWKLQKFSSQEEKDQFCREAKIMAELEEHPHIVKVKDFAVEPIPYIAMGLEGESLRKIHFEHQQVPLPLTLIIDYVKQMASALDFMHICGVVHCDVKPENTLVKRYQGNASAHQIALADFGIAQYMRRFRHMASSQDRHPGTPQYMAPELFNIQNNPTPKSDQYSLAVVTYELLSGGVPFTGNYQSLKIFHYNSD